LTARLLMNLVSSGAYPKGHSYRNRPINNHSKSYKMFMPRRTV